MKSLAREIAPGVFRQHFHDTQIKRAARADGPFVLLVNYLCRPTLLFFAAAKRMQAN